jgi:molecular chaperone IbpA
MRNYDFSPYYRSSIGFDRMLDVLAAGQAQPKVEEAFPPYDIERLGEDSYRITLALAGYAREDILVMTERNALLVEAQPAGDEAERTFLHRGISQRPFRRQFDLADFVKVAGAAYENGLLEIDLVREIPEAMKPRRIEISAAVPESVTDERRAERRTESMA